MAMLVGTICFTSRPAVPLTSTGEAGYCHAFASNRLSALIWLLGGATDADGGDDHFSGSCNNSNQKQQQNIAKIHLTAYSHNRM
ncbi:unnamed protein product [Ceratitis capitata]|uniref:(Mediterranean fruit fly) hypothetical protein n=1 Tax=Ceratitis capitata TaxID=7213 RepID=A0A811V632_CERCA|nr:unnamed protein product [Ceratitis capitata]